MGQWVARPSAARSAEVDADDHALSRNGPSALRRRTKAEITGDYKSRFAEAPSGRAFADHAALVQILIQADDARQADAAIDAARAGRVGGLDLAEGGPADDPGRARA